jgi:fructosamine-3-kinase
VKARPVNLLDRLAELLGSPVRRARPVGGGDICAATAVELADGRRLFAKTLPALDGGRPGFFAAEARGLRWLGEAVPSGGAPVASVAAVADDVLVLEWIEPGRASPRAAEDLGRALAATHEAGAPAYGSPDPGFIGSLPLPAGRHDEWAAFWAAERIEPFLRLARDRGAVGPDAVHAITTVLGRLPELAGPAGPPARLHGDLWSGNVIWPARGPAHLIDPAAQGGHRETDLAMLALFGAPHLPRILSAYAEVSPLADGWEARVPLHQLHPLLVHAVLFGGGYGVQAGEAARAALSM